MVTEDQTAVIEFLSSPATHGGAGVERVDTHSAIVFLAGSRALKLKRAVRFDYLDFSTADRRHAMCDAELHLNRRTAPTLYRDVLPIVRAADGALRLGGPGIAVDWIVDMNRFDEASVLDRIAARGQLDVKTMTGLASHIASFHADAARRADHGGRDGMAWVIEGNAASYNAFAFLDPIQCEQLTERAREALERVAPLLDTRRERGFVRQCHGDLHLRNIVMLQGQPTLFDAIEFNDEIACVDVLYDLAFLLMDLWRRQLPCHANALFNRYLTETGESAGLPLLPLFLSCRAAIRAKTSATTASLVSAPTQIAEWQQTARDYLALAIGFLDAEPVRLIAVGGISGTGKSTLARNLAPHVGSAPGAVVLRSDEIRKELCGVSALTRLGPEGYSPETSARVYLALAERARTLLERGRPVIVDAVFGRDSDRQAIRRTADAVGVPFFGVWLSAPTAVLLERVGRRMEDPSDAGADVVREQIAGATVPTDWPSIDASAAADVVSRSALEMLRSGGNCFPKQDESQTSG